MLKTPLINVKTDTCLGPTRLACLGLFSPRSDSALIKADLSRRSFSEAGTAVYGPVRTVVWEGGAVRLLPIPIGDIFTKKIRRKVNSITP